MALSYRGTIFDKRGCYVILPASPFWRFDYNDNTAEADEEVEVLEGPEVEVTDSCESKEEDEVAEMESVTGKNDQESHENFPKENSQNRKKTRTEPDNKYYEVEAILDGPKKRREHLFKVCYKVRWKGYGPDADTWQPIADLANVQDMIDEYKNEKAAKKLETVKKKNVKNITRSRVNERTKGHSVLASSLVENGLAAGKMQYDPVYGTVKDTFWKDLELGRHQNYTQLFDGDMYSKVKGFKRSAHTDAITSIHRKHSFDGSALSESDLPCRLLRGDARKARAVSPLYSDLMSPPGSPISVPLTNRMRKRSDDVFSPTGHLLNKRSRKSRETTLLPFDEEQTAISSVTSETVAIVTTSSPLTPPGEPNPSAVSLLSTSVARSPDISVSDPIFTVCPSPAVGDSCHFDDSCDDSSCDTKGSRMTVSSETMLTVTTETKRLDVDIGADDDYPAESPGLNVGASGDERLTESPLETCSGGSLPASCRIKKNMHWKRSPLDALSEASGAVERSHDEDCLWNGACNRSDCKSNRRRNMKNGHKTVATSSDTNIQNVDEMMDVEMDDEVSDIVIANDSQREEGSECCHDDREREHDGQENKDRENSSCASKSNTDSSKESSSSSHTLADVRRKVSVKLQSSLHTSSSQHSSSQSLSAAQMKRLLFSSPHADSSDSSFDDVPAVGIHLSKEAVCDSFYHMDQLHVGMSSNSTSSKENNTASSSSRSLCEGSTHREAAETRKRNADVERPGLFSEDNDALNFTRKDSEFSRDNSQADFENKYKQRTLSASAVTTNPSSPGKENFAHSRSKNSGQTTASSYGRLHHQVGTDLQSAHSSVTSVQDIPAQTSFVYHSKRDSEISQPLLKIPSPNSQDYSLDQRIKTMTCDELDDFPEQGEEQQQKDICFISNADLLQAVNLGKAEVVRRAIRQFRSGEHLLDFEQPDISGVTLLMRAVQKGTMAVVEMLLDHGVNVNAQQTSGTTSLMIAAEQNGTCLVALLLKYGANSSLYTLHSEQAETALMKAIKRQNQDVVGLMLRVGVNIAPPTCTSLSALDVAVERRNHLIEGMVRFHCQRLEQAFQNRVLSTLEGTAKLLEPLFSMQCFPLRESDQFTVKFSGNIQPVSAGEGFLLFIAHTKITEKGVRCRFHGGCPVSMVTLNGIVQTPLTKEVHFVTSFHPVIQSCNSLVIHKLTDYTSKAKLVVQAFRARLLPC